MKNGDLGASPGTSCTGFPAPCTGGPGVVNGTGSTLRRASERTRAGVYRWRRGFSWERRRELSENSGCSECQIKPGKLD